MGLAGDGNKPLRAVHLNEIWTGTYDTLARVWKIPCSAKTRINGQCRHIVLSRQARQGVSRLECLQKGPWCCVVPPGTCCTRPLCTRSLYYTTGNTFNWQFQTIRDSGGPEGTCPRVAGTCTGHSRRAKAKEMQGGCTARPGLRCMAGSDGRRRRPWRRGPRA